MGCGYEFSGNLWCALRIPTVFPMNAVVKLKGYEKVSEFLTTIATVPVALVPFARTMAGVPEDDPGLAGLYPLAVPRAEAITAEGGSARHSDWFEYCLTAIVEDERFRASAV